ncbi:winged helix-turn-helix domain-containing protein [Actinospica durhamensis]|uniref:Winged helix-turn-helix domain-containing protein n=1 Tax=Actinospica durhamensis TaxID=1508375 RepID=A0A941EQ05_9ACTN|nr:winged helix-turn-helix domain-containing protein [Actinospica durhamensis]
MQYVLLGPVSVNTQAGPLEINGTLRRTLLAALLLRPNQVVSADQLAELLWGDRPRVSATTSLYNQVMRLRQALGPHAGRIRAVPPGYVIDVEPGELDTSVFAEHRANAAQAAQAGDWETSSREYAAALDLWHGEPLADVPALQSAAAIQQLVEERILAVQGRIEADLHLARHDQVIGELRTLIDRHPWREAFYGQLMLALYRAGRQPEALDVYRDLRRAIAAEFAVEPGENVRSLHTGILRSDPCLALPAAEPGADQPPAPLPVELYVPLPPRPSIRQLPADTRAFTGREAELDTLVGAARAGGGGEAGPPDADASPTVVISAINGMGGIGKTTLAVRAAHRLAEDYPDGQLFIDLHGHSADLDPISSQDALDYLLRSLGLEPKAIPRDTQERAALYRSRLAGTRTLIVLDNARNPAQVKPLIPAEPGCLVLVTSRNLLTGLDDAELLSLDALSPDEAVALLSTAAGPGRVSEDDPAARGLTEWCGRLPLAIRIIGARLRHRPMLAPEALLAAIRADCDPLALLKDDDRDITRVFASSLDVLPKAERQLFARLGLVPGPDFDALAAAALQGAEVGEAEHQLENLFEHSLLIQREEGRYRLHDLLRAYARVRAAACDPAENEAAWNRLLDYYVETAAAAWALYLHGTAGSRPVTRNASGPAREDRRDAKAWFDAEQENLFAVFGHATLEPKRRLALALSLNAYVNAFGPFDRAVPLLLGALDAARTLRDPAEELNALRRLGQAYHMRGMIGDAIACFEGSLAIARRIGDRLAEARALRTLGWSVAATTETALGLGYIEQAVEILREIGNLSDEATTLAVLAGITNHDGRFEDTVAITERALRLSRELGDEMSEGMALFQLSHAVQALGRFDEVEPILTRALHCYRDSPNNMGGVLQEIGRLWMRRGRLARAREYIERALEIFTRTGFAIGIGYAYGELGRIRLRSGDVDTAARLQQTALRTALDAAAPYIETFARTNTGYVLIARQEFAQAQDQLRAGLDIATRAGFLHSQVEARVGLCALVRARDGAAAALAPYREVLEFIRTWHHPVELAAALVGLGRCEVETGDPDAGVAHLREAISLYARMGSDLDVAETRRLLPADQLLPADRFPHGC